MQYAVHKLLGGIVAGAGNLYAIFGGDPPDDQGPLSPEDVKLPFERNFLIEAAHDAGVLDDRAAALWQRNLMNHDFGWRLD